MISNASQRRKDMFHYQSGSCLLSNIDKGQNIQRLARRNSYNSSYGTTKKPWDHQDHQAAAVEGPWGPEFDIVTWNWPVPPIFRSYLKGLMDFQTIMFGMFMLHFKGCMPQSFNYSKSWKDVNHPRPSTHAYLPIKNSLGFPTNP